MARTVIFDDRPPYNIIRDETRQIPQKEWNHGAIVWVERTDGVRMWAMKDFVTGGAYGSTKYKVLEEYEVPNEIKAMMLLLS